MMTATNAVEGIRRRGPSVEVAAAAPPILAPTPLRQPAVRPVGLSRLLVGVLSTLTWMLFSSAVIILNKQLYASGFEYPSTVTGVGQLVSAVSGFLLAAVSGQRLRPPPSPRVFLRVLLPIAACTASSMYFGNMTYLYLSVSFIQILKAFTPAITLALCVAAGLERPSGRLLVAIAMIVGGTAGAVLVESGAPSFRLVGFMAFMASSLTEAARVVGAELLRDGSKYNTAESLVYIGGPTAALLLAIAAVWEWPGAVASAAYGKGFALLARAPWTTIAAPMVSALVNMSCFFAINATSSLTFKVAGCVKNVAVVVYGVLAHGDAITALQVAGYAISVVGFTLYSQLKMAKVNDKPKRKT
ncbi:hypothetical protein Vafri_16672 [Volvox africanus]|uniref:Sugar phosphate transporter domain-containing protein n=1 Tax=Volvox africanus TaxID=51714 RepID=A0A8J4BHT3_9CHLO|nr:hypothetical protein Vafri_16672 [Volvox africanus]